MLRELLEVYVQALSKSHIFGTVKLDRTAPCCMTDCIHAVAEERLVQFEDMTIRL